MLYYLYKYNWFIINITAMLKILAKIVIGINKLARSLMN